MYTETDVFGELQQPGRKSCCYSTPTMKFVEGTNDSLRVCETVFYIFGIWRPKCTGWRKNISSIYSFVSVGFILGVYFAIQVVDFVNVWGDLSLMTATAFLLFSDTAVVIKISNIIWKQKLIQAMLADADNDIASDNREAGKEIIKSCNRESSRHFAVFTILGYVTVVGWATGAEDNELPLRAWYPFDTTKSPYYEVAFAHQMIIIIIQVALNLCQDTLVTSMMNQCRCRFQLVALSLRTLSQDLEVPERGILSASSNSIVSDRLRHCIIRHQTVLDQVTLLQKYFSLHILVQMTVSTLVLCVTMYQLAFEVTSFVQTFSMVSYLLAMTWEVFLFCYHGNQLVVDNEAVSYAAFEAPWYTFNIPIRRSLLIIMARTVKENYIQPGGITELSLRTFMAIVKASYTFFTVLQQFVNK